MKLGRKLYPSNPDIPITPSKPLSIQINDLKADNDDLKIKLSLVQSAIDDMLLNRNGVM